MSLLRGGGGQSSVSHSEDLSAFASAIATMLNSSLKNPNDEEFQKNCIKDFLRDSFGYSCNTRGKVDLAIYDDEIPKVLFEVK